MKRQKITTMRDSSGQDIPIKYVSKYDRECDKRTRRVLARFQKARKVLEQTVVDTLADIESIQSERDTGLAARGNFQCQSFDGMIRVAIDQSWQIRLDDRVREARDRMLAYAKSLCDKAGDADALILYQLVEEVFAVGKSGGLSVGRVLSLCRRNIVAAEWQAARTLLLSSIKSDRGRAYIRVSVRPDAQHDFAMLRLDLADCWPVEKEVGV